MQQTKKDSGARDKAQLPRRRAMLRRREIYHCELRVLGAPTSELHGSLLWLNRPYFAARSIGWSTNRLGI